MALSAECERAGFTCTRRQMRFPSNLNIQLNVCTYRHAHTHTHGDLVHTLIEGQEHAACGESRLPDWQHLTWMLTHAQHQLSIWPWPAGSSRKSLKHQLPADSFPPFSSIFSHFPHLDGNLRCAVLRYWNSSKQQKCLSAFKHSHIHSHIHTHTYRLTHTHTHALMAFAAAAWDNNFANCIAVAESVAYFSAPTARQLSPRLPPDNFLPVSLPNIPHSPPTQLKVTGKCFRLSSA